MIGAVNTASHFLSGAGRERAGLGRHDLAVQSLYAAATREVSWESALDAVLLAMGFEAATFYVHDRRAVMFDPSCPVVRQGLWHRLDPRGEAEYRDHYFRLDPRVAYTLAHPGTPLLYDHLFTSDEEMRRGEYQAWYRRATGMAYALGGHVGRTQPFFGSIALHRPKKAGPSALKEHEEFLVLFSHLERALGIEYRLYQGGKTSMLHAVTDDGPNGIVLLNGAGRIIHANASATRFTADGTLRLQQRIAAGHHRADAALKRAVAAVLAGAGAQTVRVPHPDTGADYLVMLSPVCGASYSGLFEFTAAAACAIIVDSGARLAPSAGMLRAALDLTAAEARLLVHLVEGRTIAEAAAVTRLSPNTLRTQLSALFRKTGTHRQVQLVQLAHTLAGAPPIG